MERLISFILSAPFRNGAFVSASSSGCLVSSSYLWPLVRLLVQAFLRAGGAHSNPAFPCSTLSSSRCVMNFFAPRPEASGASPSASSSSFPLSCVLSGCATLCAFSSRRWHDPSIVVTRPILVVTLSRNRACSRSHLLWTVPGLRGRIIICFTRIRTLPCLLVSTLTIQSMIRRSVSQPPRHFELATWRGLQVEPLLQQHTLKQCSCIEPRALHIIYIWFIYLCLSSYLSIYLLI